MELGVNDVGGIASCYENTFEGHKFVNEVDRVWNDGAVAEGLCVDDAMFGMCGVEGGWVEEHVFVSGFSVDGRLESVEFVNIYECV